MKGNSKPSRFQLRALTLAVSFVIFAAMIAGTVTNWFRYFPSLEGILVLVVTCVATLVVLVLVIISGLSRSPRLLGAGFAVGVLCMVAVLITYHSAIGGFPILQWSDTDTGPSTTLQTRHGQIRYWLELRNPFSRRHREYLVIRNKREIRIPIQIFLGPSGGFADSPRPSDWGTLSTTEDPNVDIFTLGPLLGKTGTKYKINIPKKTATKIHGEDSGKIG